MNRNNLVVAAVVLALALAGCASQPGDDAVSSVPIGGDAGDAGPAAGTCPEGSDDCPDAPQLGSEGPVAMDETAIKQSRRDAKYYLGRPQHELTELIRVGRIDDEQFMLTEDYVVGRITVELDTPKGEDKPIVTSATVELPDGPETFKLQT